MAKDSMTLRLDDRVRDAVQRQASGLRVPAATYGASVFADAIMALEGRRVDDAMAPGSAALRRQVDEMAEQVLDLRARVIQLQLIATEGLSRERRDRIEARATEFAYQPLKDDG